jgi:hypothetical protein
LCTWGRGIVVFAADKSTYAINQTKLKYHLGKIYCERGQQKFQDNNPSWVQDICRELVTFKIRKKESKARILYTNQIRRDEVLNKQLALFQSPADNSKFDTPHQSPKQPDESEVPVGMC